MLIIKTPFLTVRTLGLAVEFYEVETDENQRKKYREIMESAARTAKLHYRFEQLQKFYNY